MPHDGLNDALRQYARGNHLRFDDQGKLVPVDQAESATDDQHPEHVTGGSGDGGKGNDRGDSGLPRHRRSNDLNDLIRDAWGY